MSTPHKKTLRLILGDQLNASHSWLRSQNDNVIYLIAELPQETQYVRHHRQKVLAFFAAMQQFASALANAGHRVLYLTLDQTANYPTLDALLLTLIEQHGIERFEYQLPDEYRLRQQLSIFCSQLEIGSLAYETEHFYLSDNELQDYFSANKAHRMEAFYRKMRARFDVLMDGSQPLGGRWNFDAENRNKIKPEHFAAVPAPLLFANEVGDINQRLERHQVVTIGHADDSLLWPINRQQALQLLNYFCRYCLQDFGRFQDAMTGADDVEITDKRWSLLHSRLSFALNSKMISPQLVVDTVEAYYQSHSEQIELAQVEGFVRQILGWREFVRGIYWANMPEYASKNALQATSDLPGWFWSGDTKMHCLQQAITQSLDYAYAHHIQRLMITGNFCLLAGIDPQQVDDWYLGIYIDAIEWVELPNTRGMSQFADGGIVGSKAYAASGNYVKNMSDYCGSCEYKVQKVTEEDACPLNALYWHFMQRHQSAFERNPRNKMVYANWRRKPKEQQQAILKRAEKLLASLETL